MLFVRTSRGLRKVYIRGYSRSVPLSVNANDGRNIDRSADIAEAYHGDKYGLNHYFKDKESSIRRDYREDSNLAAAQGVPASELNSWLKNRDDMLDQLNEQKDDVFDLASLPESSSDNDGESVSDNNKLSPSDNNASTSNNGVTGTSDINAAESNSNDSSHHAQDSSDVVQTDFSSFDPFEE